MTASFEAYLASLWLELRPDPVYGRTLHTKRGYVQGDTIYTGEAFTATIFAEEALKRCHYCLRLPDSTKKLMRCGRCKYALYCDAVCQKAAWPEHRDECANNPANLAQDPEGLLLRRTCRALLEIDQLDASTVSKDATLQERIAQRDLFLSLLHHYAQHPRWLLDHYTNIAKTQERALATVKGWSTADLTTQDLVLYQCRFGCNNFAIHDALYFPIGSGVYPVGSLWNHSCQPNCAYAFDGRQLRIYALTNIQAGDSLTLSYVDVIHSRQSRQEELMRRYYFQCQCIRCSITDPNQDPLEVLWTNDDQQPPPEHDDTDDWIKAQLSQAKTDSTLQLLSRQVTNALAPCLGADLTTYHAAVEHVRKLFINEASTRARSRYTFRLICEYFNQVIRQGQWEAAANASRYKLAFYLLAYPRYQGLIGLELFTLASCLWNMNDASVGSYVECSSTFIQSHPSKISKRKSSNAHTM
jgi:hypothetical protein